MQAFDRARMASLRCFTVPLKRFSAIFFHSDTFMVGMPQFEQPGHGTAIGTFLIQLKCAILIFINALTVFI